MTQFISPPLFPSYPLLISFRAQLNKAFQAIGHLPHPVAAGDLTLQLKSLKNTSDICLEKAKEIEVAFDNWLKFVMELHQVASCQHDVEKSVELANEERIAQHLQELEGAELALKQAKTIADTTESLLLTSKVAFEKASKNIPGREYIVVWFIDGG